MIANYGDGRLARRAEQRLAVLARGMGDGRWADVLGQYQKILGRYGGGDRIAAIAAMERLVADNPEFPLAGDARFWIASSYRHDGRL